MAHSCRQKRAGRNMKRRNFLSGLVAAVALAGPALAQDYVASVIEQLKAQGFRSIRQERTLLGRVRIIGVRKDGRREIIINPNNGEILRDLWMPMKGEKRASDILDEKSGGGSGGDDDDEDGGGDDGEGGGDDGEGGSDEGGGGGDEGSGGGGGDDDGGDDDDDGGDDDSDDDD